MITKEIKFLETLSTLIWNGMSKQDAVEMIEEHKQAIKQDRPLPIDNVSKCCNCESVLDYNEYEMCDPCSFKISM